jgi:hypothetical protein
MALSRRGDTRRGNPSDVRRCGHVDTSSRPTGKADATVLVSSSTANIHAMQWLPSIDCRRVHDDGPATV